MTLSLHTLQAAPRRRRRRVGRGNASGRGTYSGKGQKGQRARSGGRKGLQQKALKALFARTPKQGGFKSQHVKASTVTLDALRKHFTSGANVTVKALIQKGVVPARTNRVKIVDSGTLDRPIAVLGCGVSAKARERITAAGGSVAE